MVMECKFGLMEPNTKDNGLMEKHKAKESFGTLMETFTMESSMQIKLMAMEFTYI